jgi:acetyl/propionyl-CoA carboxylase alpha subunit
MLAHHRIKKLLIANRGEIARRIHRAASGLGIETVLVVSDPDRRSLAAQEAGAVYELGGSTARESYLDQAKVIEAARHTGCDAVHPGYGFLSEDGDFAERAIAAGLTFVGPSPQSIRALGIKTAARESVSRAGVPITPGSEGGKSDQELRAAADAIGYPVIIKAAAGGGGRGMRVVHNGRDMAESLERARAEGLKNFGSESVYLEKFIVEPRHVEVQLFGDTHGNIVHFGTRDCSAQRRHQKLVEEGPAPFLDPETREKIHDAAIRAARSVGYYNAGTAEFLVRGSEFYFLEINTRIQVEHPVTELITGVDLVQLQLRVAMGEKLPMRQEEISFNGHAVELRINAEDVMEGFRPAVGTITEWRRESPVQVREECGYRAGDTIPPFYDSLMSKVIAHGSSRAEALYKAFQFLKGYGVDGMPTTIPFHAWILANRRFQEDGIDIGYVERTFTKEDAEIALALIAVDPAHRGAGFTEKVSGAEGAPDLLLTHEEGGTFLAQRLGADGSATDRLTWRRAASRAGALE